MFCFPKEDIRAALAETLDVDLSALSDIDIKSDEDVMQVLFYLEETLGLEIERTEEKTSFILNNKDPENSKLISYLYAWYLQKKSLPSKDNMAFDDKLNEYRQWQARFPKDLNDFWKELKNSIDAIYDPIICEIDASKTKITMMSEFLLQIRKLIQTGIFIEVSHKLYGVSDGAMILSFNTSELISQENTVKTKAFAEFLCNIKNLNEYGITYYTDFSIGESGTKISYTLRFSPIAGLTLTVDNLVQFEKNKSTMSDYAIDLFEKKFAADLKSYELNLPRERDRTSWQGTK